MPPECRRDLSYVSRAQRSTKRSKVVRCRPGIVTDSEPGTIPNQRCTASRCTASGKRRWSVMNEIVPAHNIGDYVPMIDGPEKVSGRAKYTADFIAPGMLAGRIFRSPYSHP